ncbi:unnamed protein product [Haemonchus placei]|uniref:SCP2 domain-containing protein n=1 Tax=Haemonchus placei TaxID=6290 RepID=A0A0N4VV71_HAEPC|nr:unnamed protein product [Haemonchus placei]
MGVLKSDAIFEDLKERLANTWIVDAKVSLIVILVFLVHRIPILLETQLFCFQSHPPYVGHEDRPFDCEVDIKEKDFMKMVAGKLRPDQAFMLGKMRLKGIVGKATRLKSLFKPSSPKARL